MLYVEYKRALTTTTTTTTEVDTIPDSSMLPRLSVSLESEPLTPGESNPGQSSIWTVSRRFLQSKFLFVGLHTLPYKGSGQEDARNACGWACHVRPRAPCLPGHMLRRGWRPSPWPARQSTSQAARQDRPVGLERLEQRWHAVYSRSDAGGLRWHQGCWLRRRLAAAAAGQRERERLRVRRRDGMLMLGRDSVSG